MDGQSVIVKIFIKEFVLTIFSGGPGDALLSAWKSAQNHHPSL